MCPPCLPAGTTTPTPMPGRTRPRGATGHRHSTLWTVRAAAVAAMMVLRECPGGAGRRRASPWASSQHARGALHGSTAAVSGRCVCDSECWHRSLRCAGVLYHRGKKQKNYCLVLTMGCQLALVPLCVAKWHSCWHFIISSWFFA